MAQRKAYRGKIRKEVLAFSGPALATVLADPLMSVVDALCVGRMCSTVQLGSLGPALAVFNFVNYFFFFLNAATAVLVTRSLACDDRSGAIDTIASAVFLAVVCGCLVTSLIAVLAPAMIAMTGCVAELIPAGTLYLRVRALGQPVVLSAMVIQASLLAQLDVITPLQVVMLGCVLNVVGDLLWVPAVGAVGAAWATLLAQVVSLPLMLWLARRRGRLPVRLRVARLSELRTFFSTAAPLFMFEAGMSTCYALIQSLSTQFTVAGAAAFQALWSPLQVLAFMTYPLKQAAQVFLPRMLALDPVSAEKQGTDGSSSGGSGSSSSSDGSSSDGGRSSDTATSAVGDDDTDADDGSLTVGGEPKSKLLLTVLAQLSCTAGALLAATGVWLAGNPSLFTSDTALWPVITSFTPYVWPPLLLLGFAQCLEGVLLGTGDLRFLSFSQAGNVIVALGCLTLTKSLRMGVHGTWVVFGAFIASRAAQASFRVFVQRRPWEQDVVCEVVGPVAD